jgi:hypothetical protein
MRGFLARWLAPAQPSNPARDLANIGHAQHRERVKATAREMRAAMGLPESEALR